MSKLQEIEGKLLAVNQGTFQNLCDAYLYFTEGLVDMHRTGTQMGKEKTTKGTPDTYFKLSNGRYVLAEYTTKDKENKRAFLRKIQTDIDKCLDETITGISVEQIDKIICCCNVKLTIKEHNQLIHFGALKNVVVELKDVSSISKSGTTHIKKFSTVANHLSRRS